MTSPMALPSTLRLKQIQSEYIKTWLAGFFLLGYVRLKTELRQKVVNIKRAVSEQMATTDSFGFLLYQVVQTGSL